MNKIKRFKKAKESAERNLYTLKLIEMLYEMYELGFNAGVKSLASTPCKLRSRPKVSRKQR